LAVGVGEHVVVGATFWPGADEPLTGALPTCRGPPGCAEAVGVLCVDDVLLKADCAAWITLLRSGGTAASTTPTANTVTPIARAGRSISSLMLRGRLGACRAEPARAGAGDRSDSPSLAKHPAMASRMAISLGWLA
jgi:hypothetical protein